MITMQTAEITLPLSENIEHFKDQTAEEVYRCVHSLQEMLPAQARKQLALVFEWALIGITREEELAEVVALQELYAYARDELLVRSAHPEVRRTLLKIV